eukprot:gene5283-7344_t
MQLVKLQNDYLDGKSNKFRYVEHFPTFDTNEKELEIMQRYDISLPINTNNESVLHGWLYIPKKYPSSSSTFPIVLMSHGMGAQKDMGLEQYAKVFVATGYAVLIFDYRFFGGSISNTTLRNYINPWNHIDDIKFVVNAAKSGALGTKVNANAIALWGTSFAGGHVLEIANLFKNDDSVKCIISQVPHLNGKAASKRGIKDRGLVGSLKVAILSISDLLRSFLGLDPIYVKIAGKKTDVAYMMLTDDELSSYFSKHPKQYLGGWQNWAPARTLLMLSLYNPIDVVKNIRKPILFIGAKNDQLCPIEYVQQAVKESLHEGSKIIEIDGTHFDIYRNKGFEIATEEMVKFLKKFLN